MADTDTMKEQVEDLMTRVDLLETRLGMLEDFIRDEESRKEMAADPDAKRSFRHA